MRYVIACLVLFLALPTVGHAVSKKQAEKMIAMTVDDFYKKTVIRDDTLDTVATIETSDAIQVKEGLFGIVWEDNFIAALIDKRTGKTNFVVYQRITYNGDWRFYSSVNYETPNGPVSKKLDIVDRNVHACSRYSCTHSENMAFEIDEALLRTIADMYIPNTPRGWKFKFIGRAAEGYVSGILPAEVVALLRKVDEYRAAHGFSE